jgi:hypothetical protein
VTLTITLNGVALGDVVSFTTDASGAALQGVFFEGGCGPGTDTATFTLTDASGVHATSNPVTIDLSCPT